MKRILLLGGIGEAVQLARQLAPRHQVIYSLAGIGRKQPDLPCAIRVGGFGGIDGLKIWLMQERIDLLLDVTHPYAAQISHHAASAAQQTGIPLWCYRRPAWQPTAGDRWLTVPDWPVLETVLQDFHRPFFSIGLAPLSHAATIPTTQHWLVRCLSSDCGEIPRLTLLNHQGPFRLEEELALLRDHAIDVIISKNSGGSAVAAKLEAARLLTLPVIMLARPPLPMATKIYDHIDELAQTLLNLEVIS